MIIHDTDDEEDGEDEDEEAEPEPAPAPRTRKAKETQTRLGVGRPVAAGGSGPRAVTKSVTVSRGKRGRPSRNVKTKEPTIEEGQWMLTNLVVGR
jgi:hypothetical protein